MHLDGKTMVILRNCYVYSHLETVGDLRWSPVHFNQSASSFVCAYIRIHIYYM